MIGKTRLITTSGKGKTTLGFSLIEVMVGLFLLGIVLLAALAAVPEIRKISYRSDAMRLGFTHLNTAIEGLRTQTFSQMADVLDATDSSGQNQQYESQLKDYSDDIGNEAISHTYSKVKQNNITYTTDTYLHYLDGDDQVIQAIVVISWTSMGESQSISSSAVFTEDGLSDKKFNTAN